MRVEVRWVIVDRISGKYVKVHGDSAFELVDDPDEASRYGAFGNGDMEAYTVINKFGRHGKWDRKKLEWRYRR